MLFRSGSNILDKPKPERYVKDGEDRGLGVYGCEQGCVLGVCVAHVLAALGQDWQVTERQRETFWTLVSG